MAMNSVFDCISKVKFWAGWVGSNAAEQKPIDTQWSRTVHG